MPVSIKGTGGGGVTLDAGAAASATTLTLPNVSGTVLQSGTTVTVAQGGTGATSLTANNVLLGNGTSAVQVVAPSTNGNLLTSNGTTWTSAAPAASVTALAAGTGISVSASTGSVTITNTQAVIPSGTNMLFFQAAAPTGWTQYTAADNRALRVVSGAGGGGGGSIAFSTMFTGAYPVGSTAITEAQMPSHTHSVNDPTHAHQYTGYPSLGSGAGLSAGSNAPGQSVTTSYSSTGISINATGSSNGHAHTIPSLQYADVIICTKD